MLRWLHSPPGYGLLVLTLLLTALVVGGFAILSVGPAYGASAGCHVCLSQIYGHGGKNGSAYNADFVELFSRSDKPQTLAGWRLDYADVHSEDWRTLDLSPLTLSPHGYALVSLKGGAAGTPLPAVDLAGNLNLGGSAGKLQLVDGENTLIDLVGYGEAEWSEGAPAARCCRRNSPGSTRRRLHGQRRQRGRLCSGAAKSPQQPVACSTLRYWTIAFSHCN